MFLQVAVERIKEYTEIKREPPEFIEPRPPAAWPSKGEIKVEDLVIRYAVRHDYFCLCVWLLTRRIA